VENLAILFFVKYHEMVFIHTMVLQPTKNLYQKKLSRNQKNKPNIQKMTEKTEIL